MFVDKIKKVKDATSKLYVRCTIAYSMIELVNKDRPDIAANILSKMVEQDHIDEATRILICMIRIEDSMNPTSTDEKQTATKNIVSNMAYNVIERVQGHILKIKKNGMNMQAVERFKGILSDELAFIVATAHDAIEMLREGGKNYENVVDYLLCIACDGGYMTVDEETTAAKEILNTMAYDEPTKNKAVRILRRMEDILVDTANGDEQEFVANVLQELANKLPEE